MGHNFVTFSCTSLYSACVVHVWCFVGCMYGAYTVKITALFSACWVHVWCMYCVFLTKIILRKNNKPVHVAKLGKMAVVSSNREAGLVNKMVLKATLFLFEYKQKK